MARSPRNRRHFAGGMGGILGKERIVEDISRVGDLCRWSLSANTLAVAHGDVNFTLEVMVSDDQELKRDQAVALVKNLLALCD